jgi:predicted branched-subunit amino acid permease
MIYDFIGALIATFIIYNLFVIILMKFLEPRNLRYISFIGSAILILIVTNFTMGIMTGFTLYLPALFIWLVLDLVKSNKKNKSNVEA